MQFAFIATNGELRRVIEGGDFAAWRTFLHLNSAATSTPTTTARIGCPAGRHRKDRRRDPPGSPPSRENPDARIVLTTYNATLAQDFAPTSPLWTRTADRREPR